MNKDYDFQRIENKWQKIWYKKPEKAEDFSKKPKHFHLVEFPYPSGAGLHVGHCMGYGASDAYCRMKRMQGFNVMFPIGWDAFGLPTENFAIKNKIKPQDATKKNIANFVDQMKRLGLSFDWSREVNTTDPDYYRWTQWIFLQFYRHAIIKNKLVEVADDDKTTPRLAYQDEIAINWCPSCKIGLANEEVISGKCERCGTEVVKKMQKQWMLRITAYAERLIKDLDTVQYLDKIKTQQVNWIGKSEGTNIRFKVKSQKSKVEINESIDVFTTRADTLFGCTYVVLAPEHELVQKLKVESQNEQEIDKYLEQAKKKSDLERTELQKDKSGVELKVVKAINPINGEEVSVWVADYVLASYGTGAVMAVPAHDDRDFEFATKYDIPIKEVIIPKVIDKHDPPKKDAETIFRKAVQAILIDPKNDKVLMLKWKKFPWTTFITGGIEGDEDPISAAKREIIEETGYKNIKHLKSLGGLVESHFYANHKGVNRKAHFQAMVFELIDDAHDNISDEESAIHELHWMSWDEIKNDTNIKCSEYGIWLDRFFNPPHAFVDYGVLINSGDFSGLDSSDAKKEITKKLKLDKAGDFTINYKLRDWVFSRQHYWGEPIPIVHCPKCGTIPLKENDLPLTLPNVENYEPTNTGESPLSAISDWVNIKCPLCGEPAKRETDTMPNWAGSSWYFLAYAMNTESRIMNYESKDILFDKYKNELEYWMPVDLYNGGMEHTTLHLLYSRFWHKFLYDLGAVKTIEPYQKRIAHGIILGPDGRKMSKSFGNVINPDDIIKQFGADSARAYIMFIGPYDQESAWSTAGIQGVHRFLTRVYKNIGLISDKDDDKELLIKLNQSVKGISEDLESFHLNTVVSKLMELNNIIERIGHISKESYDIFIRLLYPVAPHLASELNQLSGNITSVEEHKWPKVNNDFLVADSIEIVVQVNGKIRDKIQVDSDIEDESLKSIALKSKKVIEYTNGKEIFKVIVIPKKLVSIVVK